jgi:hypothetical protein
MNQTIITAINSRHRLHLVYDGFSRIVEPHAYGVTKDNDEAMLVWQVRGGSQSDGSIGWRLLRLDETRDLQMLDDTFQAPRPGYKGGDRAIERIYARL